MSHSNLHYLTCTHPDGAVLMQAEDAVTECLSLLSGLHPRTTAVENDLRHLQDALEHAAYLFKTTVDLWKADQAEV